MLRALRISYDGGRDWNESHPSVALFWTCLEEMSEGERSKFIRFAWGRNRLPRAADWKRPFKLTQRRGGDDALPVAHTCFFQLELPAYASLERCKQALDICINFGIGTFDIE